MLERDKDRTPTPALLALALNRRLRTEKGWPRMREALIQHGYTPDEVSSAIQQMPEMCCYDDVKGYLEQHVRRIPSGQVKLSKLGDCALYNTAVLRPEACFDPGDYRLSW